MAMVFFLIGVVVDSVVCLVSQSLRRRSCVKWVDNFVNLQENDTRDG